jgi:ABC-type branched-subunit amino acid transport system permease subunit
VNGPALLAQRVLDGLANGALYGSLAVAIALVHRATGRVNMAQGELATFGTYVSLVLASPASPALAGSVAAARFLPLSPWPLLVAIAGAMAVTAVLAALVERVIARRVPVGGSQAAVSVSVALLLVVNAVTTRWWRSGARPYRSPFPNDVRDQFVFGDVRLRYTTIGTWATLLVVLLLLHALLLRTRFGLAYRAVSSRREHAALCGIRVGRVTAGAWALAAALGTLVGCLAANRLQLNPSMMVRLLVYSLVAATIGGLSSPGGALVGGVLVGVGQSLIGAYVPRVDNVLAFPLVVLAMIVMLYVRPQGLFGAPRAESEVQPPPAMSAGRAVARWRIRRDDVALRTARRAGAAAVVGAVAVGGFALPYLEARLLTQVVATAIALWGLGLLVGDAGRISLGHGAFMGVGAYATAVLAARTGMPSLTAALCAAVIGFAAGVLVGLPALRIRGQHLAMVTFSLAVVFPSLVARFKWFTGGELGPPPTKVPAPPGWLGIPRERTFAWLHLIVVAIAVVVAWLVHNLRSGAVGRAIRAAAQDETAAASVGVGVTWLRTLTFGTGAALGALGGALVALQTQAVTTASFDVFRSLALYALVVVCGAGSMVGAALAALVYVGLPWLMTETGTTIGAQGVPPDAPGGGAYLVWGFALLVGAAIAPDGIVPAARRRLGRLVEVVDADLVAPAPADDHTLPGLDVEVEPLR